jgi:hypothetical protein
MTKLGVTTSNVYPSGGDFAAVALPTLLAPVGRFST